MNREVQSFFILLTGRVLLSVGYTLVKTGMVENGHYDEIRFPPDSRRGVWS
jgi:hypothetical protein